MKTKDPAQQVKQFLNRVKVAQAQVQGLLRDRVWAEEVRKYAERQGKEVSKLLKGDVAKLKTFLERERKELERIQREIPGEVAKLRGFLDSQRDEFEKLLGIIKKEGLKGGLEEAQAHAKRMNRALSEQVKSRLKGRAKAKPKRKARPKAGAKSARAQKAKPVETTAQGPSAH